MFVVLLTQSNSHSHTYTGNITSRSYAHCYCCLFLMHLSSYDFTTAQTHSMKLKGNHYQHISRTHKHRKTPKLYILAYVVRTHIHVNICHHTNIYCRRRRRAKQYPRALTSTTHFGHKCLNYRQYNSVGTQQHGALRTTESIFCFWIFFIFVLIFVRQQQAIHFNTETNVCKRNKEQFEARRKKEERKNYAEQTIGCY